MWRIPWSSLYFKVSMFTLFITSLHGWGCKTCDPHRPNNSVVSCSTDWNALMGRTHLFSSFARFFSLCWNNEVVISACANSTPYLLLFMWEYLYAISRYDLFPSLDVCQRGSLDLCEQVGSEFPLLLVVEVFFAIVFNTLPCLHICLCRTSGSGVVFVLTVPWSLKTNCNDFKHSRWNGWRLGSLEVILCTAWKISSRTSNVVQKYPAAYFWVNNNCQCKIHKQLCPVSLISH